MLFVLCFSASAHAYTTEGCYWPRVYRGESIPWTNYASGPDAQSFFFAKNAWNAAPTPVYIAGSGNNIQASGAYYGNTGWDGITYYSCPNAAVFVSPVNVYENDYYTNSYSARDAESVTTHEFGHALGLNHSYCGTLMYYGTGGGCRPNTPQGDDVNGINHIY